MHTSLILCPISIQMWQLMSNSDLLWLQGTLSESSYHQFMGCIITPAKCWLITASFADARYLSIIWLHDADTMTLNLCWICVGQFTQTMSGCVQFHVIGSVWPSPKVPNFMDMLGIVLKHYCAQGLLMQSTMRIKQKLCLPQAHCNSALVLYLNHLLQTIWVFKCIKCRKNFLEKS